MGSIIAVSLSLRSILAMAPNFLVIVADDLGFSDIGCFGSEIRTPNLDALGRSGTRFTDFHTAAACSPTRSMLMSGTDHHLTGLGQLIEFTRSSPAHQQQPGHAGYLRSNIATLPEVLRDNGYYTLMAGKWHLGLQPEHAPFHRGFSRSFAMLPGCCNHYGWEPQLEQTATDQPRFMQTSVVALHMEEDKYITNADLGADFYSSDKYTGKLLQYLEVRPRDKPFFAYLPFSAPHWPLQSPKENMEKYKGVYDDGPDALRLRRLQALQKEGLVPKDVVPHPVQSEGPEWTEMDETSQKKSSKAMEAFAGMVDRIDYNVGRVVDYLKTQGEYENTTILFMSDNGAEGSSYEARSVMGDRILTHVQKYYDNSLENIGRYNSYVWYGPRWAQASTAPSRLYKWFSTEGGIRVPFFMKAAKEQIKQAPLPAICNEFCTVMDIMPTFLELAGVKKPGKVYNGRGVEEMIGTSWVPYLSQSATRIHPDDEVTGWELVGQAACRRGKWKANFVNKPFGTKKWELHDLSVDPGEINDLSVEHANILEELVRHWRAYAKKNGVVGLKGEYEVIDGNDPTLNSTAWMNHDTSSSISRRLNLNNY